MTVNLQLVVLFERVRKMAKGRKSDYPLKIYTYVYVPTAYACGTVSWSLLFIINKILIRYMYIYIIGSGLI